MGYLHYHVPHGETRVGRAERCLRLGGRWLAQLGFWVGDGVQVTAGHGFLLIIRQDKG